MSDPGRFASALLRWYRRHRRDLPWRRTRDPYAILVAETMLQQTQVATVIPYYRRFIERFPTVQALARAKLDDVLRLWAGLGYYSRARNLHAAAAEIIASHGGQVPASPAELRELPGVGPYTAGAIASIAFDQRAPVVDGNVARVMARLFAITGDIKSGRVRTRLWSLAESVLPRAQCGEFNQALMELGSTVCTPVAPACPVCPVRRHCRARQRGWVDRIPRSARRARSVVETHVVAAIRGPAGWLFRRRPQRGLWGGLWELPSVVSDGRPPVTQLQELVAEQVGAAARLTPEPFHCGRHVLTHRTIHFVCHLAVGVRSPRRPGTIWRELDDINGLGLSRAMQRIVDALRKQSGRRLGDRQAASA